MYTNILYPTDGSSGANAALEHARELAVGYDATLHVLFVIDAEHIETGMMPRAEDSEHRRITGMMKRDEETKGEGSMLPNEDIGKKLERRGGQLTEEIASVLSDEGCETVPVVREGTLPALSPSTPKPTTSISLQWAPTAAADSNAVLLVVSPKLSLEPLLYRC